MSPLVSLWLSRFTGGLGYQIFALSGLYQIYKNTQSATMTGMLGLWLFLPGACFNLVLGKWADKIQRSSLAFLTIQCATVPLGMALFSKAVMSSSFCLFAVVSSYAVLRAARSPFYYVLMNQCAENLSKARVSQLSTLSWQLPLVLGPLAFSFAYGLGGNMPVVALSVFFFALAAYFSFPLLRLPQKKTLKSKPVFEETDWKDLYQNNSLWLRASLMDAIVMGSLTFGSLMPFLLSHLQENPAQVGFLKSAISLGTFICVGFFEMKAFADRREAIFKSSLLVACLSVFLIPFSQTFTELILLCFLFGMSDGFSILYRDFLLFSIDKKHLGKASAVSQILNSASEDLGELRAGSLAGFTSPHAAVFIGVSIAATATLGYCMKSRIYRLSSPANIAAVKIESA